MEQLDKATLNRVFPWFSDEKLLDALLHEGRVMHFSEGDYIMDRGMPVEFIPLLYSGSMRIVRRDEDDNELLLYYLKAGETCASSLTCCMDRSVSEVEAIAEEDAELIALPSGYVDSWMEEYPEWKAFVMKTYHDRFQELLETIDAIAFHQLDERMLRYFRERIENQNGDHIIRASHQEIANDLHSRREVISRLLKQMQKEGIVNLGRNRIEVLRSN